jgi:hypothetical protein
VILPSVGRDSVGASVCGRPKIVRPPGTVPAKPEGRPRRDASTLVFLDSLNVGSDSLDSAFVHALWTHV